MHEAYLRLVDVQKAQHWNSRGHFFAAAAEAMRRILVEQARRKNSREAGGGLHRVELSDVAPAIGGPSLDILALNEALDKLEAKDPRKAQLVKLRFFSGLTIEQAAEALGVATSTAEADWLTPNAGSEPRCPGTFARQSSDTPCAVSDGRHTEYAYYRGLFMVHSSPTRKRGTWKRFPRLRVGLVFGTLRWFPRTMNPNEICFRIGENSPISHCIVDTDHSAGSPISV